MMVFNRKTLLFLNYCLSFYLFSYLFHISQKCVFNHKHGYKNSIKTPWTQVMSSNHISFCLTAMENVICAYCLLQDVVYYSTFALGDFFSSFTFGPSFSGQSEMRVKWTGLIFSFIFKSICIIVRI